MASGQIISVQIYGPITTCCCTKHENLVIRINLLTGHQVDCIVNGFSFHLVSVWNKGVNCHSTLHLELWRLMRGQDVSCSCDQFQVKGSMYQLLSQAWIWYQLLQTKLCEILLLNNSHFVCPLCTAQIRGGVRERGWNEHWGKWASWINAMTILSMARDGRLSTTMAWPIRIPRENLWAVDMNRMRGYLTSTQTLLQQNVPWNHPKEARWGLTLTLIRGMRRGWPAVKRFFQINTFNWNVEGLRGFRDNVVKLLDTNEKEWQMGEGATVWECERYKGRGSLHGHFRALTAAQ